MDHYLDELAKNVSELIKRYNRLKEEHTNLMEKVKEKDKEYNELKTRFEEIDFKRVKLIERINRIISEIEQFIPEENRAEEEQR